MVERDSPERLRQEIYMKSDNKILFARMSDRSSHSNTWVIGHYTLPNRLTYFIMNHEFAMLERKYNINVSINEKKR